MPHDAPPLPPAWEADRPEAPAKPKRAWSKPAIKKMPYVNVVASGPTPRDISMEHTKYRPTSS